MTLNLSKILHEIKQAPMNTREDGEILRDDMIGAVEKFTAFVAELDATENDEGRAIMDKHEVSY